jgi:hypothetical protein
MSRLIFVLECRELLGKALVGGLHMLHQSNTFLMTQ